jgi:hypothetical protein
MVLQRFSKVFLNFVRNVLIYYIALLLILRRLYAFASRTYPEEKTCPTEKTAKKTAQAVLRVSQEFLMEFSLFTNNCSWRKVCV